MCTSFPKKCLDNDIFYVAVVLLVTDTDNTLLACVSVQMNDGLSNIVFIVNSLLWVSSQQCRSAFSQRLSRLHRNKFLPWSQLRNSRINNQATKFHFISEWLQPLLSGRAILAVLTVQIKIPVSLRRR